MIIFYGIVYISYNKLLKNKDLSILLSTIYYTTTTQPSTYKLFKNWERMEDQKAGGKKAAASLCWSALKPPRFVLMFPLFQ